MHRVMIEISTIKFLTGDTILKPRTKVASGNKTDIQVFRNHIPCPRILKLIRQNKWFNPPDEYYLFFFFRFYGMHCNKCWKTNNTDRSNVQHENYLCIVFVFLLTLRTLNFQLTKNKQTYIVFTFMLISGIPFDPLFS